MGSRNHRSRSPLRRIERAETESPSPPRSRRNVTKESLITRVIPGPLYSGPEKAPVNLAEQKKIQIDIRRNIPKHRVSNSPIRRVIDEPLEISLPRRPNEGKVPIFNREEIKKWAPESKVVMLRSNVEHEQKLTTESKVYKSMVADKKDEDKVSIHERLGIKSFRSEGNSIKSRLGVRSERVLDREELESQRPEVKPWDVNPEFVPRGRNYYEHDDREDEEDDFSGHGGNTGSSRYRGKQKDRFLNNGGGRRRRRTINDPLSRMEWKHDKFEEN